MCEGLQETGRGLSRPHDRLVGNELVCGCGGKRQVATGLTCGRGKRRANRTKTGLGHGRGKGREGEGEHYRAHAHSGS